MPPEVETITTADLLGHVVAWQFPSNQIAYSDVRKALESAGLNPEYAKELRPAAAFSRAAKGLKEQRRIDKVKSEKGITRFQLTHVKNDGEQIDFTRETEVKLESETGIITCPNAAIEQQARDLFRDAMATRTNNDCTRLVQELFKQNADLFPLVPEKGVAYFVPVAHSAFLAKVRNFAEACGGSFYPFPVPKGTAIGNASVRDTVASGLANMISELNAAVSDWDDTTRASTTDKAIKRWEQITYKTEAYAVYLETEKDKLTEALAAAKEALTAKILAVETAKEEKKAAKEATEQTLLESADSGELAPWEAGELAAV